MTLYVTPISFEELGKIFNISNRYRYLDIDKIISINGLKMSKDTHRFILNGEIENTLNKYERYSRMLYKGILYHNSNMTKTTIESLKELEAVTKIICIDWWKNPLKKELHEACDEVIMV